MKTILKSLALAAAALLAFASCQEFQPVGYGGHYTNADPAYIYSDKDFSNFVSVKEIKALYTTKGKPIDIKGDKIMKVQVISNDESGNIYKDLYVQDATVANPSSLAGEALCIKVGKGSMYADYKFGQTLYINCDGLTLGQYDGSLGLGLKGYTTDIEGKTNKTYETSYIELYDIIDSHIFKGAVDELPTPKPLTITAAEVAAVTECHHPLNGKLVKVVDMSYADQIFGILNCFTEVDADRIFLSNTESDRTTPIYNSVSYGLKNISWSKNGSKAFFDSLCEHDILRYVPEHDVYMGSLTYSGGQYKDKVYPLQASSGTSLYFTMAGSTQPIILRTSGYAKFADTPINLNKGDKVTVECAIFTYYNSKIGQSYEKDNRQYQLTLLDIKDLKYANK